MRDLSHERHLRDPLFTEEMFLSAAFRFKRVFVALEVVPGH